MVSGLVYFVTYDNAAWRAAWPVIKIGSTRDLRTRLHDLNTGSPVKLIIVGSIWVKNPFYLERYFHTAFTKNRLNGEWFKLDSGMISVLRNHPIVDDRFDELFNFDPKIKDEKDLEIITLKAQIKSLMIENDDLKSKLIKLQNGERAWHTKRSKMVRGCK